jgi:peptidoglycan/LPS O-acetylase OafA/YrhL
MNVSSKNSLDFLRLTAALFVLYSHQYALLGLSEPSFFGWNSFGGAGVTVFFFLSGMLVWLSWARDPNLRRFFQRRSLRIFPALLVIVLVTIFVLGPILTTVSLPEYFRSNDTWRYLTTAMLFPRNILPGVFEKNPYPYAVNGSLWTLPVEYLCYLMVAVVGSIWQRWRLVGPALTLIAAALLATYAPIIVGDRFSPHFEMIAIFWWGALFGYSTVSPRGYFQDRYWLIGSIIVAALIFSLLGPRGTERMAMLLCAAMSVVLAQRTNFGARLTDRLGDLSYGIYIYAFPVQQVLVYWSRDAGLSFGLLFFQSVVITFVLAYFSWHLIEYQALRLKPRARAST